MRISLVSWALLGVPIVALGAPSTGKLSSSEHPLGTTATPQRAATYGLCSGPQNADDFPSSPVPNVETQCEFTQQFHSTSPNASYGGSCGGQLSVQANTGSKDYQTVSIDIIGTQGQGQGAVRKRVKASIDNVHPNGKCPTATYTPRSEAPPPR